MIIKRKKAHFLIILSFFVILLLISIFFLIREFSLPFNYKNEIVSAASANAISPAVVASLINAESKFNPNAISKKGAVGLMQIKPTTAEWIFKKLNIEIISKNNEEKKEIIKQKLLNPQININAGCYYLNYLLKKFNNLSVALAAYNAGETTVKSWLANPIYSTNGTTIDSIPYMETENYVNKVNKNINHYAKKFT